MSKSIKLNLIFLLQELTHDRISLHKKEGDKYSQLVPNTLEINSILEITISCKYFHTYI